MKITKTYLKQLIREELLKEGQQDLQTIKNWFEDLTYNDEAGSMGVVTRGDFARFIRLELQISREEAKVEADRLWPMAHDYFEKEGKHNYSGTFGAPFDLEP